jgi:hypothetical protein
MDGTHALPHPNATLRQHGDEFACAGLQHETSDDYPGYRAFDDRDQGLTPCGSLRNSSPAGLELRSWAFFKAEPQTSALEPIIRTPLLGSLTATYIEFYG